MRLTRTPVRPHHHCRPGDHRPHRGPALGRQSATSRPAKDNTTSLTSKGCDGPRRSVHRRVLLVAELVAVALLASGATAHADTVVLAIAGSVDEVLTNIRNWLMGILAGLATVFLTIGGVRRVFGGGDPGEQEKAKECFKAAGIGYALAALAPLVVTVLKGIVGA